MKLQLLAIAWVEVLAGCVSSPVKSPAISESFVRVEPGTFWMGSENGDDDEKPVHGVTISHAYYISRFEVKQKQWQELMGTNRSYIKGDELPAETVSWEGAVEYCNRLSREAAKAFGAIFRPTGTSFPQRLSGSSRREAEIKAKVLSMRAAIRRMRQAGRRKTLGNKPIRQGRRHRTNWDCTT